MTPAELYDRYRSDVVDKAKPYLWSDEEVWDYMNDAYSMFWRLCNGIPDFTSIACRVPIVSGVATSKTHPSILRIVSAQRASDFKPITIHNSTDATNVYQTNDYGRYGTGIQLDDKTGPVNTMVIGMQKNLVRWVNIPEVDDACNLVVFRLPLRRLDDSTEEIDELEEIHHIHLLKWMKSLGYAKQDAETFDRARANENDAAFRAYCEKCTSEQNRYAHKTRAVSYGGI